ncbi:fungal-specific transcription factor domain-containing protein [Paraphoma chrysanthemicola]|uniref:Fungal-specific transcription factor domain-containing protein n=1 Tax=Paraphoma chrysanthemicola TaxID=798071 RepID=A0A8K0R0R0_9PLEO|nr:fungal-specific transcription factor domain-containing protein [Paraphoma chrysanthemicola]
MVALLRELRNQVSGTEKNKIDELLSAVVDDVADAVATLQKSPDKHGSNDSDQGKEQGEAHVSAEVGSSADLDLIDEDLMHDEQTRATGFIGKASEIQWLRKLHSRGVSEDHTGPYGPPGQNAEAAAERLTALRHRQEKDPSTLMHTSKASFFLDDEVFEMDLEVDPFELPSFEDAERLMLAYMGSCHNSFPFLAKRAFTHQFYHYYAALNRGKPYDPPQKWQAQLNLVFAIGAVYSHLTAAEWRGDERDHLIYHSRAWALSLKDPWWFSHPDLPQMQITGLLSFYYLSIGHINRSWILIGMALRFGYALGLHIRNEDRASGAAKKEVLARVWWGHYSLERLLAAMTGRPSIGINRTCSVPLPLPLSSGDIEETIIESRFGAQTVLSTSLLARKHPTSTAETPDSPTRTMSDYSTGSLEPANSGSYLKNIIQLGEITQDALNLYTASTVGESWQGIQRVIARLTEEIEVWATSLPDGLNFFKRTHGPGHRYEREQNTLELLYHGTMILITRPCLCRLDRRISNQTAKSSEFNQRTALTCVESAKAVARLLPAGVDIDLVALYEAGPWWSMVHTIMQSLVVLLLEVSYEAVFFPHDRQDVLPSLKKLVRWLRAMRTSNGMARRAYTLVVNLLKVQVTTIKMDIRDLLLEDEAANAAAAAAKARASPPHEALQPDHLDPNTPTSLHPTLFQPSFPQVPHVDLPYTDSTLDPYHFPSDQTLYAGPSQEADNSAHAYLDLFTESWGTSGSAFPGLFFTSFDEQNPLPGFSGTDPGSEDFAMGGFEDEEGQGSAGGG